VAEGNVHGDDRMVHRDAVLPNAGASAPRRDATPRQPSRTLQPSHTPPNGGRLVPEMRAARAIWFGSRREGVLKSNR